MRLDKFLTDRNVGSRSEVKSMIKKQWVRVNDEIAKRPEMQINPEQDVVLFKEQVLTYEPVVYYMLHKPMGVVSATEDKKEETVVDLLRAENRTDLFPVGRLDKDTEGLLLLTNDGQFAHNLLSPRKHVKKTYFARVDVAITEEEIVAFQEGLDIGDDKLTLPATLQAVSEDGTEVWVTITEGRFHQVKRMFQVFHQKVLYLKRITMGNLQLDENLPCGAYRKLTTEELQKIW